MQLLTLPLSFLLCVAALSLPALFPPVPLVYLYFDICLSVCLFLSTSLFFISLFVALLPSLTPLSQLSHPHPSLYLFQGEEEKKTLRSSLVALQAAYEEKERMRLTEISLKQRAEADLTKYKVRQVMSQW
jgi:hypothetical protein